MKNRNIRENEVAFCADVKSWLDALFSSEKNWPFSHAKIEQYGRGSQKRSDLRVFRKGSSTPLLAGEVKFPGTPEGRNPYSDSLMQDAFNKADNIQAPYFFTWNVNKFVLFDRSRWNAPMLQRRVKEWDLGLGLTLPEDCSRPEVQLRLREKFLPAIFTELAAIVEGKVVEWGMPPDDIFIRSLESHLDLPIRATRDLLAIASDRENAFAGKLQSWMTTEMNWTFDPDNEDNWRDVLERAARTLCYIFCNRAIFYEAIRARYPGDLTQLTMPRRGRHGQEGIYRYFRGQFNLAVQATGDYEPVFYPEINDWAGSLVFGSDDACQGWSGLFRSLQEYDFRKIPYDIVGGIFQKLISPEERQKFGQFYTSEDIVDIINAFCIHRAGDVVIDPACGSGSFLVRAYHRKAWISEHTGGGRRHGDSHKRHDELLREIYGCDVALFAAHLATLNLAARHIEEEENYPHVARGNFFEVVESRNRFCTIPGLRTKNGGREKVAVPLVSVDAVVGNPPYVRQEHVPKRKEIKRQKGESKQAYDSRLKFAKEHMQELCQQLWPGLKLSGRSDLHCYFWPVAAKLLNPNGYFGFLTSSSWLDVEYGFALQGWILKNFKLIAVIESLDEPWFQDARVKTAVTILQRCDDQTARMSNIVKFVRLLKPVKEILGDRPHGDEAARQNAAKKLQQRILKTDSPFSNDQMRIVPIVQKDLWDEGVRAGDLLKGQDAAEENDPEEDESGEPPMAREAAAMYEIRNGYVAGKWGRFLRAPDLYFRLMREYRSGFVRLGEIAEIKRGITSGCDAFFMPHDVTEKVLAELQEGLPWNDFGLMSPCKRSEVESGKVRIVKAGDGTLHPVETEYLRPELHSLMNVDRPVVRARDVDRVVLWVSKRLDELPHTHAAKYIRWGAKQTFASEKSKPVPTPNRSSCRSRPLWYDLTGVRPGIVFWAMAHKYRHIAPANLDNIVCNHNLFYIDAPELSSSERVAVTASLNSTLVGLFKHFYGRYAGSEGMLKTEVIDSILLEVPNPRGVSRNLAERMKKALAKISQRNVRHLVEEALLECHDSDSMRAILVSEPQLPKELRQPDRRELDLCVLEMIGVADARERETILEELYLETVKYYRYQRTQDIQAMENRAGAKARRFTPQDLAEGVWHSLPEDLTGPALIEWMHNTYQDVICVEIPEGKPEALGTSDMWNPTTVVFRQNGESAQVNYASSEHAELVSHLAAMGIRGEVNIPREASECRECLEEIEKRVSAAREVFLDAASIRTGIGSLQEKTLSLLLHWYIHGKSNDSLPGGKRRR